MEELQAFQKIKKDLDEKKIKEQSVVTLMYYEKIGEMLEDPRYADSENFLSSVQDFIMDTEFITEKQKKIVDRIFDHPHDPDLPF